MRETHAKIFSSLVKRELNPDEARRLTESEIKYCLLGHFNAEVCNGGLEQFFTNPYGKDYERVILFLQEIGAANQARLVKEFLKFLPKDVDPKDPDQVGAWLFANEQSVKKTEELNEAYYSILSDFYCKLVDFASKKQIGPKDSDRLPNKC
jgi:hypothetical protein